RSRDGHDRLIGTSPIRGGDRENVSILRDRQPSTVELILPLQARLLILSRFRLKNRHRNRFGGRSVLDEVPRLGRSGIVQRLVWPTRIVLITETPDLIAQLVDRCGPLGVEEAHQGLVGAFVLALSRGLTGQSADGHGAMRGEEYFHGSDRALPELVER